MGGGKLIWKVTPPGPQQVKLERLFRDGAIKPDAMPNDVRKAHKDFEMFAPEVFRTHFNKTKAKLGCYLKKDKAGRKKGKRPSTDDSDPSSAGDEDFEDELMESGSRKSRRLSSDLPDTSSDVVQPVGFSNPPIFASVYTDPNTNNDRVLIIALMYSGTSGFHCQLSEDASIAVITYQWPQTIYDVNELFKKDLDSHAVEPYHPKIVAVRRELEQFRSTMQDPVAGAVHVKLPIPVQTEVATWTKSATARSDGSIIVVWELKAFERAYTVTPEATGVAVEHES